ncbi:benenodin family lasso peptide [Novosphingobium kaempferiae]|nr:benenodin family lasso peptide [Novosphingobium kaempferiae]
MERDHDTQDSVIELGTASIETLGPQGGIGDDVLTQPVAGLSDD